MRLWKKASSLLCAIYLSTCMMACGTPSDEQEEDLLSFPGSEEKADGPNAVAKWDVRSVGGAKVRVLGYGGSGNVLIDFSVTPTGLGPNYEILDTSVMIMEVVYPEMNVLKVPADGSEPQGDISDAVFELLKQFQNDMMAAADGGKADGFNDFACRTWSLAMAGVLIGAATCVTGAGCGGAALAGVVAGISGVVCVLTD